MAKIHKLELYLIDFEDYDFKQHLEYIADKHDIYYKVVSHKESKSFKWEDDLDINQEDCTLEDYKKYFDDRKAILNLYDNLNPSIEVGIGDYVISNTDDFGLKKDKEYKIINIPCYDEIEIEVSENKTEIFSVDWFNTIAI